MSDTLRQRCDRLQAENDMLREVLRADVDQYGALEITSQERALLAAIMRHDRASAARLELALETDRPTSDGRNPSVLRHAILRLRRKLAPKGVDIRSKYGEGYFMTVADKATVRAICEVRS